jgi:hypothetical protein
MTWLVFGVGFLLAVFGAGASAALVSVGRIELTRAASRRLRGGPPPPPWLARIDQQAEGGIGAAV